MIKIKNDDGGLSLNHSVIRITPGVHSKIKYHMENPKHSESLRVTLYPSGILYLMLYYNLMRFQIMCVTLIFMFDQQLNMF